MINWKKYPKKKILGTGDSIVVSRPDGTTINFDSPISVDNSGNATFSGNVTIQGDLSILNSTSQTISFGDSDKLKFGDGDDLKIYHNGTNNYIDSANSSDLYIRQEADDKDIIFQCDDGSGGVETYFYLDGNAGGANPTTIFPDNSRLAIGSGQDLKLYHSSGGLSYFDIANGSLTIRQTTDDGDIIFQCDDGSGGVTEYFRVDGSSEKVFYSKNLLLFDGVSLQLGTGTDATLFHDGSEGTLQNYTGNFRIIQGADNGDIQFFCDDGSGGVTEYLRFDGGDVKTYVSKDMKFNDSVYATFGNNDLTIGHDGTNSRIYNYTGNLQITNLTDDADIVFQCDDGSGGLATYMTIDGSTNRVNFNKPIKVSDNTAINIGSGLDLRLSHDGTDSTIRNYAGDLKIIASDDDKDIIFQSDDGSGGVETYFKLDGSDTKLVASKNLKFDQSPSYIFFNGNNTFVGELSNSGKLQLRGGGSNNAATVYIDSSGNMGLGTSAPSSKLDVRGTVQVGVDDAGHDVKFFGATSGRYLLWDESQDRLEFVDSVQATFGSSSDFKIYHDGSNAYQTNDTGHMYFINYADDSDIVFQSDDGSGGATEYFRLDGSSKLNVFSQNARVEDNIAFQCGGGNDLRIYHNATDSYVDNANGDLYIRNLADDKDIIFQSDDGSGGVETYFFLDGSNGLTTFPDDKVLGFGNASDLRIKHDGSNSYIIQQGTGDLIIENKVDDKDIIFKSDDGSGGLATYFYLDGSADLNRFTKNVMYNDNVVNYFGGGFDLQIKHDGTNSKIINSTGDLTIENGADDKDIIFKCDDGSGGVETYFFLDGSAHNGTFSRTIFPDNSLLGFGTGFDAYAYHDGSHFVLQNNTGNLKIQCATDDGDVILSSDDGSGGTTAYITLDGSDTDIKVHKNFEIEKTLTMQHTADPSDPATGHSVMWSDTSGNLKVKINVGGSVVTRTLATGSD